MNRQTLLKHFQITEEQIKQLKETDQPIKQKELLLLYNKQTKQIEIYKLIENIELGE